MFGRFRKENEPDIYDEPIDKILEELRQHDPDTPEFETAVNHLERLTKLKAEKSRKRANPDTRMIVMGNLLAVLIIVVYEQKHVMRSTAMSLWMKVK